MQAQDRCHRIGQTREVHIYRLVTEHTIEENILRKSDQKRALDHLAIQSGGFNTEFLQRFNPRELLGLSGQKHFCTVIVASLLRIVMLAGHARSDYTGMSTGAFSPASGIACKT